MNELFTDITCCFQALAGKSGFKWTGSRTYRINNTAAFSQAGRC